MIVRSGVTGTSATPAAFRQRGGLSTVLSHIQVRVLGVVLLVACSNNLPAAKLAGWLEDWERTRRCLVAHGFGQDTATATAIAELTEGDCGSLAALRYPGLPDDRSSSIVSRWAIATELVDDLGKPSGERGAAIDKIDAEVVALRAAMGKPRIERDRGAAIEVLPPGRELIVAGAPLIAGAEASEAQRFNAGAIHGTLAMSSELLAMSLDDVRTAPTEAVAAWPSLAWTAEQVRGEDAISIGPVGGRRATVRVPGDISIMFALEGGDTHIVLVQTQGTSPYAIVVSIDRGKRWRVVPAPERGQLGGLSQRDPYTGGVDLILRTSGYVYVHRWAPGSAWWLAVTRPGPLVFPTLPDTPIPWPSHGEPLFVCSRGDVTWGVDGYRATRIDAAGFHELALHGDAVGFGADCRRDTMVLVHTHPDRVELCRGTACEVVHEARHDRYGAAALLDDATWIYAAVVDDIVGVWRESAAPVYYRLVAPGELRAITVLRGVPHLVLGGAGEPYRFVPLPG